MKQYVCTIEEHFQDQLMELSLPLQIRQDHIVLDNIYLINEKLVFEKQGEMKTHTLRYMIYRQGTC
jgi:hypothetical protein